MLNEGWRRHQRRSADVVVGYVETHGRALTAAQIHDLEIVPRRTIIYRGQEFEEMDVDAVLARAPDAALVDEFAHTNVPGSRNEKRWQDVEELLDAGIEVITTVNIQHLESMNDVVEEITGIKQQETVPDAVVRRATEIELVDMSAETLRRRMAHGNIYPAERIDAALANYFRVGNLDALRELSLLWVADRVDEALDSYRDAHGITRPWETRERVVVAITGAPGGDVVIRRAARMAERTRGDLIGVHVRPSDGLAGPVSDQLKEQRELVVALGGRYQELAGADIAGALVRFARSENATQIVLGASRRSRLAHLARGSVINTVVRASGPIDVHVISADVAAPKPSGTPRARRRRSSPVPPRRRLVAWLLVPIGTSALTVILTNTRSAFTRPTVLLWYVLLVVAVAATGGFLPAAIAALACFTLANYYFTQPYHTFRIAESTDLVALLVFVLTAAVVGVIVSGAARRRDEAARARADAETLAALSGTVAASDDALPEIVTQLRDVFAADAVAVLQRDGDAGWRAEAVAGSPVPQRPEDAVLAIALSPEETLVVTGRDLGAEHLPVLRAFAGQIATASEQRRLRAAAAQSGALSAANELRTALLAAVSHDLRSPLASIKACSTSLLQDDVDWSDDARREFYETIDEETDRLNTLVGNLLDMSRLQTGGLQLVIGPVGIDEVTAAAVAGVAKDDTAVVVEVPESLPPVRADAALLERAVANIVENAVKWSSLDCPVHVEAGQVGDRIDLRVIDHGPGIPPAERDRVFQPFQRFGDEDNTTGVGLGLALARGFVEAMGAELVMEDTPGGGLTMVVSVPLA
jgi:two-component system sensor histidine kinase KdpD